MTKFWIEQSVLITTGFFIGAALATCIAPGNIPLWVGAGVLAAIVFAVATVRN